MRFRQSRGSSAIDHLFNIRQTGSVEGYRERFEELPVDLPHVTPDILKYAFLNGLRRNLKDQVVRCRPVNLADIVEIAKLIESQERNNLSYQVRNLNRVSFQPPTVQASSTIRAQDRSGGKQIVSSTRDTTRASGSGEARNPNPCRNCAERWFPGHKCKQQRLKSLAVTEEEEEESPLIEELNEPLTEEEEEPEEGFQVMALSAMSDDSQEHSLKMRGYIKNTKVVVLTNSGATCNFISEELVRQMGWPVTQTRSFGVRVGGGRIIKSSGKCVDGALGSTRN